MPILAPVPHLKSKIFQQKLSLFNEEIVNIKSYMWKSENIEKLFEIIIGTKTIVFIFVYLYLLSTQKYKIINLARKLIFVDVKCKRRCIYYNEKQNRRDFLYISLFTMRNFKKFKYCYYPIVSDNFNFHAIIKIAITRSTLYY